MIHECHLVEFYTFLLLLASVLIVYFSFALLVSDRTNRHFSSFRMDPQHECRKRMTWAAAIVILLLEYYRSSSVRILRMTSNFVGDKWVVDMYSGHPIRFNNIFRMTVQIFMDLLQELSLNHGLQGSSRTTIREVLAITLYILSQNESIRGAMERFQHSSETILRYFSKGIQTIVSLAVKIVRPEDPSFVNTPGQITTNPRYMPYFNDCISAIDGTHVDARLPSHNKVTYIGRSGSATQNIMTIRDFNMCFTYVMAGWEGSAHDSRIFSYAIRNRSQGFPHPPSEKYYLVDVVYPMQRGYLKPYLDTRYNISDFERASGTIRGRKMFNKRHSSLQRVIERTFEVWKKKWVILRDMPTYPFQKQVHIVVATMTLHNFIRRHLSRSNTDFSMVDNDELNVYEKQSKLLIGHSVPENDNDCNEFEVHARRV
uniref:Transposase n=1 Tax=Phalaenopsis equestris TaxID=78828 RepID=A0A3R5SK30_PHAEQ|nr:transposase [Phalaenopsis equestris]